MPTVCRHLLIEDGGELKGSDRIRDFKIVKTRMEGQTLDYFAALVNADGVDGFTITGPGTINGNGQKYWEEFWIRRKYNPQCTNMEAMRPRNVYISNSKNVTVQDVKCADRAGDSHRSPSRRSQHGCHRPGRLHQCACSWLLYACE